ncbi:MAG: hypothetical protein ACR2QV_03400, partial [Gammaproteobacteria bacterium]
NTYHENDSDRNDPETTTLMQLVEAVDGYTSSTEETVHVIRHMLLSRRVCFEGQPDRLQLD